MAQSQVPQISIDDLIKAQQSPAIAGLQGVEKGVDLGTTLAQKQREMDMKKAQLAQQLAEFKAGTLPQGTPYTVPAEGPKTASGDVPLATEKTPQAFTPAAYYAFTNEAPTVQAARIKAAAQGQKKDEWKDFGVDKDTGNRIQTNGNGEYRTVPNSANVESSREMYPNVRMAGMVGDKQRQLAKDLNPKTFSAGTPEGQDAARAQRADRIFTLVDNSRASGGVNLQVLTELAREVDNMLVGSGQSSESITHDLRPDTAGIRMANMVQFVSGHPQYTDPEGFLKLYEDIASRVKGTAVTSLEDNLATKSENALWLKQHAPQIYRTTIENAMRGFQKQYKQVSSKPGATNTMGIDANALDAELKKRGLQ